MLREREEARKKREAKVNSRVDRVQAARTRDEQKPHDTRKKAKNPPFNLMMPFLPSRAIKKRRAKRPENSSHAQEL